MKGKPYRLPQYVHQQIQISSLICPSNASSLLIFPGLLSLHTMKWTDTVKAKYHCNLTETQIVNVTFHMYATLQLTISHFYAPTMVEMEFKSIRIGHDGRQLSVVSKHMQEMVNNGSDSMTKRIFLLQTDYSHVQLKHFKCNDMTLLSSVRYFNIHGPNNDDRDAFEVPRLQGRYIMPNGTYHYNH